jgi:hypothetical protein
VAGSAVGARVELHVLDEILHERRGRADRSLRMLRKYK